ENGHNTFYYPITTNSMCLQCHGIPNKTIQPEVLTTIIDLYPNDKAIGYNINEVRGIWVLNFE
ncbi:MAG TPA: cytochrome c family protein, partial [Flavobacteriaceae bacterium]|nr:cytochrome c family protein [Flavobacteriaceae bacterium]